MPFGLGFFAVAGAGVQAGGSYDLLATELLTTSAASVTFSGLSAYTSTYKHLQIRMTNKTDRGATNDQGYVTVNGDTGSNYAWHRMYGDGSSVPAAAGSSATRMEIYFMPGDTATPSQAYSAVVMDILDPFNTSKNTTFRVLGGDVANSTRIGLWSGAWFNTAALTSVTIDQIYGSNFLSGSRFSLYGLRSA